MIGLIKVKYLMQLIIDLENPGLIEQKLKSWAVNLSSYSTKNTIGRYILDQNHAKLWVPELVPAIEEQGYTIDKAYLEVYKRTVNSDWQKFIPENRYNYALHVPLEGCDNWVIEYMDNTDMPFYDKQGISYCSQNDAVVTKHYGYKKLDSMFIMRTDRQWRRTHLDRPQQQLAKSLLITLTPIFA